MWKLGNYVIQPCLKMNYMMCEESTEILKVAEKNQTVFMSEEQVNKELIYAMN